MSYLDFPAMGQITFQDPASPIFEGIIDLHHNIFFFFITHISSSLLDVLLNITKRKYSMGTS